MQIKQLLEMVSYCHASLTAGVVAGACSSAVFATPTATRPAVGTMPSPLSSLGGNADDLDVTEESGLRVDERCVSLI